MCPAGVFKPTRRTVIPVGKIELHQIGSMIWPCRAVFFDKEQLPWINPKLLNHLVCNDLAGISHTHTLVNIRGNNQLGLAINLNLATAWVAI